MSGFVGISINKIVAGLRVSGLAASLSKEDCTAF